MTPQSTDGAVAFVIPEPVKDALVIAAVTPQPGSLTVQFYDLTALPRLSMGGFSVVQLSRVGRNTLVHVESCARIGPLKSMTNIQDAVKC